MIRAVKTQQAPPSRCCLDEFDCRLDRIGSRGAAELNFSIRRKIRRKGREQFADEPFLEWSWKVKRLKRNLVFQGLADGLHDDRMVMAKGERASPRKAVDIFAAFGVRDEDAAAAIGSGMVEIDLRLRNIGLAERDGRLGQFQLGGGHRQLGARQAKLGLRILAALLRHDALGR